MLAECFRRSIEGHAQTVEAISHSDRGIAPAFRAHNRAGVKIMRKLKFVRRERVARNPMPAASATEQTGLIPALPEDDAQKASYQAVMRTHRQKEH